MANNWEYLDLEKVTKNFDSKRIPLSSREREKRRGRFPYYGATKIMDYVDNYLFDGLYLLISEDGSVETPDGTPFLQLVQGKFWVSNHAHVLQGKTDIDTKFLYYSLSNVKIRPYMTGSVQAKLSQGNLNRIKIPYPEKNEREAIANTLGALDDKIEVNRRMNATLESMARAVFREMMKDEGGRMKGWEVKTIGEGVTVVGGSTPSTTNPAFWEGGNIHWATPKDLAPLQSPILLDTNSRITELGLQQISSRLLPAGTVLLSSRAPIGYLAISQIPVAINQGFIAIKCTEEMPNYYILNWAKENMEAIESRANGTTFLEISKSNFRPMPIVVPPPERMKAFVQQVEPMYQKIIANLKESRTLASLRDGLLSRLMRGEVRVKSA